MRAFFLGSTGSGKSTLVAQLSQHFLRLHPSSRLYVIDPKKRFFPKPVKNGVLYPEGTEARVHGNRKGVTINARFIHDVDGFRYPNEQVFLVQDHEKSLELLDWLYKNPNVYRTALVILDESFDFFPGVRAHPSLRRLIQQGRELSTGIWIINQRPAWIDQTLFSETERMYIGRLFHEKDRKRIFENSPMPKERSLQLLEPMPKFSWFLLDKEEPALSFPFKLRL